MRIRVGRNEKCPCGSGLKYKKCHINDPEFIMILEMKASIPSENIENNGLLTGRPFITTEFKGHKVVAVGSRVYAKLPKNITFHEFIITFLKDILTPAWGTAEQQKPKDEQHIIVQWIAEMAELLKNSPFIVEDAERELKSAEPSGNVLALLSLAYDIYSIYHCSELPDELVNRLKNNDQFQGAKYEIAIAGIFARAGFEIHWIPKSTDKICEFKAINKLTKQEVIVEAKSRHRQGVLNRPGQREDITKMRSQIGQLFNKALGKSTEGLPYFIFIDINLPLTEANNPLERRWVNEIKKLLSKYPSGSAENPDIFTGLFITNFSWHYLGTQAGIRKGESVSIIPLHSKATIKDPVLLDMLQTAINQYGLVPPTFPK